MALIAGAVAVVVYYCYRKEERQDERRPFELTSLTLTSATPLPVGEIGNDADAEHAGFGPVCGPL